MGAWQSTTRRDTTSEGVGESRDSRGENTPPGNATIAGEARETKSGGRRIWESRRNRWKASQGVEESSPGDLKKLTQGVGKVSEESR